MTDTFPALFESTSYADRGPCYSFFDETDS